MWTCYFVQRSADRPEGQHGKTYDANKQPAKWSHAMVKLPMLRVWYHNSWWKTPPLLLSSLFWLAKKKSIQNPGTVPTVKVFTMVATCLGYRKEFSTWIFFPFFNRIHISTHLSWWIFQPVIYVIFFGKKKNLKGYEGRVSVCVCHLAAQGSMTSFANSQLGQICPQSTKPASRWIIELQFETYTTKVVRRHLICSDQPPCRFEGFLDSNFMEQLPRPPRTLHGRSVLALSRLANSCWRFPRKVEEISIYCRYFCVNCIESCH